MKAGGGLGAYRAMLCRSLGPLDGAGATNFSLAALPRQPLPPGHVRVGVKAAGVNFFDALMLRGDYQFKPPLPFTPGAEAAGIVLETAAGSPWQAGDAVLLQCRLGAYAEEIVAPAGALLRKPAAYSFAEAAAFPVGAATAWGALVARGGLQPGENLLVLGAGGGMGLAAVALGARLGARVYALAASPDKRQAALDTGAAMALDADDPDWPQKLKSKTGGINAVFDPVGGDRAGQALRCLAPQGRYLVVGFAAGSAPHFAANRLLLNETALIGVRAGEQIRRNPALAASLRQAQEDWLASGAGRPLVGGLLPLERATEALLLLARRQVFGKLVLTIGE